MGEFLKFLKYVLLTVALMFWVLFIAVIFLWGGEVTSCGEGSESVVYARELPYERLTKLYYDLEKFSLDPATPYFGFNVANDVVFPEPFSDIKAVSVRPKRESIMLNGCFDHYVVLDFHGFNSNKELYPKRQIILSWGEHDGAGSEVIWSE